MSTRLTGDVSIVFREIKIQLTAENVTFGLTLTADYGTAWRYSLSEATQKSYNQRAAFGRIIAADYRAALRQAASVLGQGYEPGTIERGLFDRLAATAGTDGQSPPVA